MLIEMDEAAKANMERLFGRKRPHKSLLQLQQTFVVSQGRWNVRSCRPASLSTSTLRRHACCPR